MPLMTRKQKWRRCKTRKQHSKADCNDPFENESLMENKKDFGLDCKIFQIFFKGNNKCDPSPILTPNFNSRRSQGRKVSFCEESPSINLIPRWDEQKKDSNNAIWWSEDDYARFRSFSLEIYNNHGTLHKLTPSDFMGGLNTSYLNTTKPHGGKSSAGKSSKECAWLQVSSQSH
mmetsp:Transcript_13911/g.18143  ORF Transcript_13911/g.18143 Transcript_13911/m.18143 type:complete len:174 (-) Transcript_13911:229-750(-)